MSKKTSDILNERLTQLINFLNILSASIEEDAQLVRTVQAKVISIKANNPEASPLDSRELLLQAAETHMKLSLKEQEIQKYIQKAIETHNLILLCGFEANILEEEKANFELTLQNFKSLFAIDETQRAVHIADTEMYDSIKTKSKILNMSDKDVEETYNSPFFTAR